MAHNLVVEDNSSMLNEQAENTGDESFLFGKELSKPAPGDEVVITGLAGVFPNSHDVYHFRDNLFNKVDMVTDDERRWEHIHPEIPTRTGKLFDLEHFDAGYFGIHRRQAESMDPMCRIFLEKTVEAIMDAGINPSEMEGTRTMVFVGCCFGENEKPWIYDNDKPNYYAATGILRSMIVNRLSYYLKLNGASIITDTACSSSHYAFEQAYRAIRTGLCDMAIVGGSNLCLHPFVSLQFKRLGVLSPSGSCKVFDSEGDGYARSEAIGALLLQKSKDARRIYARVLHAKTNCDGYKSQGITYPSGDMQKNLLQEFYHELEMNPTQLSYLEAHGTGTKVGDPEEIDAIDAFFCKGRTQSLLVGSVKSNIGHTEPAAGVCSITKILIAYETGFIPPNINFSKPREGDEALEKKRLQVVVDKMQFQDNKGLCGVSSFGFGGANAHILLKWNEKVKDNRGLPNDDLPRLVCVSARVDEGIDAIFDDLISRPLDAEHVRLYHQVFRKNISGHPHRGYSLVSKQGEIKRSKFYYAQNKKPVYLGFTGLGENWCEVGRQMYVHPLFAASIQRIDTILAAKSCTPLSDILTKSCTQSALDQILGNMAVLIGISDLLKAASFMPDYYFGAGLGELVAAYYQNLLTLEETVLTTYCLVTNQRMNVVGQILKGVKVPNVWISKYDDWLLKLSSEEIPIGKIKQHALVLQIGNRKIDLKSNIILSSVGHNKDYLVGFFSILGELYQYGCDLTLDLLYPTIPFPVSRSTPMLSPLIKWNHKKKCFVMVYRRRTILKVGEQLVQTCLRDENFAYMQGHMIDGRCLFPATGYLLLVWDTAAKITGRMKSDMRVVFENIKFMRATALSYDMMLDLNITVQRATGQFEVMEGDTPVVSGSIKPFATDCKEQVELPLPLGEKDDTMVYTMTKKDIYKELRLRGYGYTGEFRQLQQCDTAATIGLIKWTGNWVAFMDSMLQMRLLQMDSRSLYVPTSIKRLSIDAPAHIAYAETLGENPDMPISIYRQTDLIKSGGVEVRGLGASTIPRRKPRGDPVLEKYQFIPNEANLDQASAIRVIMQLILENIPLVKVKVVEICDEVIGNDSEPLAPIVHTVLGDLPLIQPSLTILTKAELQLNNITVVDEKIIAEYDCLVIIGTNLLQRMVALTQAMGALRAGGFILSREPLNFNPKSSALNDIDIITKFSTDKETLFLVRKSVESKPASVIDITGSKEEFDWLPRLQQATVNDRNIIVLSQNEPLNGVLGLVNCLRREPGCGDVRAVFTLNAPAFDLEDPIFSEQLDKNLAINVYKDGKWGTYRHLLLDQENEVDSEQCFVNTMVPGDLSSLKWIQGSVKASDPVPNERELVFTYYSALNFRDIMTASGRISTEALVKNRTQHDLVQGFEFVGRKQNGERVMGFGTGGLSTIQHAYSYSLWTFPDYWTMEEAVTIPVVYATVLYTLMIQVKIRKGQSILIHAGSGGIGQAAISLCLHHGLIVYTTLGTQEKRDFLKKCFPQLCDKNIGNSRDVSFEQMVMKNTNGRGVDYVVNSLAEEKLLASVRCLAQGGSFLEIGKFDLASNNHLLLQLLAKDCAFHGVMVDSAFNSDPKFFYDINKLIRENILNGAIKPIERKIFKKDEIEKAFRYMAGGKHIGKVVIELRKEEKDRMAKPTTQLYKAYPRYHFDSLQVHIVVGGLGGFGLELADWLVIRGARNIVLTSRKGVTTGYQALRIRTWKSYNTRVVISTADVTTRQGCEQLIEQGSKLGKVQSIFNLAVVLKDGLFENQTEENYRISLEPKAYATKHLDEVTRLQCPELRDFVVFSSVSCGRGNAGQTNYGMANSVMERICEKRREEGLPALAIEWGAVGDVGLVAEMQEEDKQIEIGGTLQQRISNCIQVMDTLMIQTCPVVSSMVVAEKRSGAGNADNIVDAVANILGLGDLKAVSLHATLSELGMDSMTAVEIKQTLEREYEVFLTPQDIRNMTFARLLEIEEERALDDEVTRRDRALGGFEMMVRHMNDEETQKIPLMQLRTKVPVNSPAPCVIFFPGLEGVAKVLQPLADNLNVHVDCLQYPHENHKDTIHEMALDMLPFVEALLTTTTPFTIVAYSFGVTIALEVVAILETRGYHGNLVVLDGAPDVLISLLRNNLNVNAEPLFQTGFLFQLLSLHTPFETINPYKDRLYNARNFEDRLEIASQIYPKDLPHSDRYLRIWATALYKRLKALSVYQPKMKLRTPLKLFKAHNSNWGQHQADDYGLSELCQHPVEVKVLKGNHVTILENLSLAEAIHDVMGVQATPYYVKDSRVLSEENLFQVSQMKQVETIS